MIRRLLCRDERGQVIPFVVLALLVLLGIISLVIDGGMAYVNRRYMQNAADAGALAAATLLTRASYTDAEMSNAVTLYARSNRPQNLQPTDVTVVANYINDQGVVQGAVGGGGIPSGATRVRVTASCVYHGSFMGILGLSNFTISASAAGGILGKAVSATVLTLNPTSCPGLSNGGSGTLTAIGGGIHVNANCGSALSINGSGSVQAINGEVTVVGGAVGPATSPPAKTGYPFRPDPLASVQPPNIGSYPERYGTPSNPQTLKITGSTSTTLEPGVYYGGIKFTGTGNVTMRPGVYIIAGGELTMTGGGTVVADGVFFYITNDPANPSGAGAYASVNVIGSSGSRYRAMTSGPYANLTFFQDRNNTQTASMSGGGDLLGGTMYFPSNTVDLSGGGQLEGTAQLITKSLTMGGSGSRTFTHDASKFFAAPVAGLTE
jgi:hypothetical protein